MALERATQHARRLGMSRRAFLVSACGVASTLLALNDAYAAGGPAAAAIDIPADGALDLTLARSTPRPQRLHLRRAGPSRESHGRVVSTLPPGARPLRFTGEQGCKAATHPGWLSQVHRPRPFVRTSSSIRKRTMIVLSFVPSTREGEPLTIEEAADRAHRREDGGHAPDAHPRPRQSQPGRRLEAMDELRELRDRAWKTYTQWGPDGKGFFLDDDAGIALDREGAQARHQDDRVHKGCRSAAVVRALDVRRRRPRREALSRRELS
jgi:hypothetical protein